MATLVLVLHLVIALALVGAVLLQRSEGGALGIGGGGGGGGGFMSGRAAGNALTRATIILAACFFATSIALSLFASSTRTPRSILDEVAPAAGEVDAPRESAPKVPAPIGSKMPGPEETPESAPEAAAPKAPIADTGDQGSSEEPSVPLAN